VRAYVEHFSEVGDVVLDPFGGTGVTAIEAFLLERRAIHNDLNPFGNFIAANIADTRLRTLTPLREAFAQVEDSCAKLVGEIERDDAVARRWLKKLPLPKNIRLPRTSDAEFYYDMFTPRQLAGLAIIKQAIDRQRDDRIRNLLLLAWSASVAKLNRTFLSAKDRLASRGGSSIFSIYRYKLAAQVVELPIWETFSGRFKNVLAAKDEVRRCRQFVEQQSIGKRTLDSEANFRVLSRDAASLDDVLEPNSVDYIFTDPPYGAFISYLDLSVLWNHWLGFKVTSDAHYREAIVGGECDLSEDHYRDSLSRSIKACMRLLRPDRWFSIVFQHWDLSYFATILNSVDACGAELKSAVTQSGDVIWSMHKKKNSASVLSGELILTFYKPKAAKRRRASRRTSTVPQVSDNLLDEVLESCIDKKVRSFSSESLFNRLVIELWNRRALGVLSLDRHEFARRLEALGWQYDRARHQWLQTRFTENQVGASLLF